MCPCLQSVACLRLHHHHGHHHHVCCCCQTSGPVQLLLGQTVCASWHRQTHDVAGSNNVNGRSGACCVVLWTSQMSCHGKLLTTRGMQMLGQTRATTARNQSSHAAALHTSCRAAQHTHKMVSKLTIARKKSTMMLTRHGLRFCTTAPACRAFEQQVPGSGGGLGHRKRGSMCCTPGTVHVDMPLS